MRLLYALISLSLLGLVVMVKQEDFKQCRDSSFCRRLAGIAQKQEAAPQGTFHSPYSLSTPSSTPEIGKGEASWTWPITSSLYPGIQFSLRVDVLDEGDGIVRIRADDIGSETPWKRYNESAKWALVNPEPRLSSSARLSHANGKSVITYGTGSALTLEVVHSPLKITQLRNGRAEVVINERSLFHMEHFRVKQTIPEPAVSEGEQVVMQAGEKDGSWFETDDDESFEERWRTWTDSKPKGPEALSLDISFPGVQHIYGLPEHASPLSLPDTVGPDAHYQEPYRLFNVDIFEYLADSPMSLYGAIPLLHAHSKSHSVGVLNLVASDTWVDVLHNDKGTHTHWMSESGILDLLLLPGPRPDELFRQYAILTGPTPLPPAWSTAYHQSRWNYIDEADVLEVDRRFDEADIPLDVTWLDIEYAEEHRYFDFSPQHFPDPARMQKAVAAKGRKMVAIVDPHIKRTDSFRIYTDARDLDLLIKRADGSEFEGWCWTGSSVWVDFFNPKSWEWWTRMFSFGVWKDSTPSLFIWNDMNEPSVFNGPEISVPRDTKHFGGWENRDVHNINGMMFHHATSDALVAREEPSQRPFVLSRSFYAGSQRFGAIWTGDNMGTWDHLANQIPMILSNNIAGMSFCGADVGGFFGNPSTEFLVRSYQAGAFAPFFRAHAHLDTKRREPFLLDEPARGIVRDIIRLRYQMLSLWYNAFHDASITGAPIVRPQYAMFPDDESGYGVDDQFYLGGEGLLIKPVVKEGQTETTVYLSDDQPYYDYFTHHLYPACSTPRTISMSTPLEKFPLLIRGGSILPIRERVRRASPLMWQDPYTLIIALDKDGQAEGQLYSDDGVGYGYQRGESVWRKFSFTRQGDTATLSSRDMIHAEGGFSLAERNAWEDAIGHVKIDKIVIIGAESPQEIKVEETGELLSWSNTEGSVSGAKKEGVAGEIVIKNPGVGIVDSWTIGFTGPWRKTQGKRKRGVDL